MSIEEEISALKRMADFHKEEEPKPEPKPDSWKYTFVMDNLNKQQKVFYYNNIWVKFDNT